MAARGGNGKTRGTPPDLMARSRDGRFAAGFDRPCVCGHTLGVHTAAAPHVCIAGDFDPSIDCSCERFERARGPKVVRAVKTAAIGRGRLLVAELVLFDDPAEGAPRRLCAHCHKPAPRPSRLVLGGLAHSVCSPACKRAMRSHWTQARKLGIA